MPTITGATLFDMYAAIFKRNATVEGVAEHHVDRFLRNNRDKMVADFEPAAAMINARNAEAASVNQRVQAAELDAEAAGLEAERARLVAERAQAEAALEVERARLEADNEIERARLAAERASVQAQRAEVRAEIQDAEDERARTDLAGEVPDDADAEAARERDVDARLWEMFRAAIARMKAALDANPAMTVEEALDHAFPPEVAETLRRTTKPLSRAWFLHYRRKADLLDAMLGETLPRGAQAERPRLAARPTSPPPRPAVKDLVDIHELAEMLGMPAIDAWESNNPDRAYENPDGLWDDWHGAVLAVAEQLFEAHELRLDPASERQRRAYYSSRYDSHVTVNTFMDLSADPDSPRVFHVSAEDGNWDSAAAAILETKNKRSRPYTSRTQFIAEAGTPREAVLKNLRVMSMWPAVYRGSTPGKMFYAEIGY